MSAALLVRLDRLPALPMRFRAGWVPGRYVSWWYVHDLAACIGCGLPTAGQVDRWSVDRGWNGFRPAPCCGYCADLLALDGALEPTP